MIKTLNPYPNQAKTAEIMSRYRPIAPKPETCSSSITDGGGGDSSSSNSLSQKIKQSPYLRNLWPQLQARPTRTRKRGRAPLSLPSSSLKRQKTHLLGFCPPCHHHHHHHVTTTTLSSPKNLTLQGFVPPPSLPQLPLLANHHLLGGGGLNCNFEKNTTPITLPLLPCSPKFGENKVIDHLSVNNNNNNNNNNTNTLVEKDLLQQLQKPAFSNNNNNNIVSNVIAPQPIRPIGSSISVGCINQDTKTLPTVTTQITPKKPEEVEQEVESETLPAVISDSNNKVRMANSAYKEMVGQPECPWLSDGRIFQCDSSKRISGEVTLNLCGSMSLPVTSNGFSCWVRIEWESEQKKMFVNAFCDVVKLACESRDYLFTWRFHTRAREVDQSSSSGNA